MRQYGNVEQYILMVLEKNKASYEEKIARIKKMYCENIYII